MFETFEQLIIYVVIVLSCSLSIYFINKSSENEAKRNGNPEYFSDNV